MLVSPTPGGFLHGLTWVHWYGLHDTSCHPSCSSPGFLGRWRHHRLWWSQSLLLWCHIVFYLWGPWHPLLPMLWDSQNIRALCWHEAMPATDRSIQAGLLRRIPHPHYRGPCAELPGAPIITFHFLWEEFNSFFTHSLPSFEVGLNPQLKDQLCDTLSIKLYFLSNTGRACLSYLFRWMLSYKTSFKESSCGFSKISRFQSDYSKDPNWAYHILVLGFCGFICLYVCCVSVCECVCLCVCVWGMCNRICVILASFSPALWEVPASIILMEKYLFLATSVSFSAGCLHSWCSLIIANISTWWLLVTAYVRALLDTFRVRVVLMREEL